jgi:hypothetical protein
MMSAKKAEMKYFKEWARDKHPFFATVARLIAMSGDKWLRVFEAVKSGERIEGNIPLPKLNEWFNFYYNHEKVLIGMFDALAVHDKELDGMIEYYKRVIAARDRLKMSGKKAVGKRRFKETIEIIVEAFNLFLALLTIRFPGYDVGLKTESDEEESRRREELIKKEEVIFFVRVLFPCVSIYGVYPIELLKKAQEGEGDEALDALDKLIRLDKSIVFEPGMAEIVHQAEVEEIPMRRAFIKQARENPPKVKIDIKTIRYSLAGLISYISIVLGKKITAVEINGLFNAIDLDLGKGGVNPSALKTTEEFEKAVYRYREFWSNIIPLGGQKKV